MRRRKNKNKKRSRPTSHIDCKLPRVESPGVADACCQGSTGRRLPPWEGYSAEYDTYNELGERVDEFGELLTDSDYDEDDFMFERDGTLGVKVGMIVADVVHPLIAEWSALAHPQDDERVHPIVWAQPQDGVPMPPGVINAETLVAACKDALGRSDVAAYTPPAPDNPCQWMGATLRQAGVPVKVIDTVTQSSTIDGRLVEHEFCVYGIDVAGVLLTLKMARWQTAKALGYALPDALDRATTGDEWKVAVEPVTDRWKPRRV